MSLYDLHHAVKLCYFEGERSKRNATDVIREGLTILADADVDDDDDMTQVFSLLSDVCQQGDRESLALLVENRIDINMKNPRNGDTVLLDYCHSKWSNADFVALLQECGANLSAVDRYGKTVLIKAAEAEAAGVLSFLVKTAPTELLSRTDETGRAPLHYAVLQRSLEMVRTLLDTGAETDMPCDINNGQISLREEYESMTALMIAARQGDSQITSILLETGATVTKTDNFGNTALHFAETTGVAEVLLQNNADPNVLNDKGETPLVRLMRENSYARQESVCKGVCSMLMAVCNVNRSDLSGKTALHFACDRMGSYDMCKALIMAGAALNQQDRAGKTPLILACEWQWEKIAKYLVKKGADPNMKDNSGQTPLLIAAQNGQTELTELFMNL